MLDHESLEDAAREVAREAGLRLVLLFGSAARRSRSSAGMEPADYDLGVLPEGDVEDVDLVELTNRFIRALGEQAVDLVDLRRADPVLALAAARHGTLLHEDPPGTFARFHSLAHRRFADTRKFRSAEREEIRAFLARRGAGPVGEAGP